MRTLIEWAGDDPDREGLLETPKRVGKAWREMFQGYDQSVAEELDTVFEEVGGYGDIVLVRDVPFYSHCEHHIVPILGKAHIAYYPREGVVGLSKLARVVDIFARRLQTQENLTAEIVNAIDDHLKPRGLAVMMEAEHMCMAMRGIQKQGVSTVTTGFTGVFKDGSVRAAALHDPRSRPAAEPMTGADKAATRGGHGASRRASTATASSRPSPSTRRGRRADGRAYEREPACARTLETGEAWYWSRSRQALWHKGETSGQIQRIVEMRVDCDQDALLLRVEVGGDGGCCHTGRRLVLLPPGRARERWRAAARLHFAMTSTS